MVDVKPRDVQVAQLATNTTVLRSRTWDRLKFEIEYSRQRGTTANSYLIQGNETALIDPPGESFTEIFLEELHQHVYFQKLNYVILGHVNPNRMATLKALLELAPQVTLICSKPGAIALKAAFPEREAQINSVRGDEVLDLGQGHELQFVPVPTPRWPDGLCTFDPATRILFSDKLFGAHVCDDPVLDENWRSLDEDRRYYFDCLHAAQTKQVEAALEKLAPLPAKFYAPSHGPIVRYSLSRLNHDYRQWSQEQKNQDLTVAMLYASAYGNTTTIAQAIAKGLTQADISVASINCEFTDPSEIAQIVAQSDGVIMGSPTLGGHAPTQIQTALGIVLSSATKTKLAGVFGSYGWSGEAVDLIEGKLLDAGFRLGFESIRVKFTPTEDTLQHCETVGLEFAQALKKAKKPRTTRQFVAEAQSDRTEQAVGRIIGSLCVLTTRQGDANHASLTAWVSQATFNPPGLTIALAQDSFVELPQIGDSFVLNILKEGRNLRRHFLKPQTFLSTQATDLAVQEAANGCLVLTDALAYLECTVQNRMECGDHWLIYAVVDNGKVLEQTGVTAVLHRKSGSQ